MHFFFFGWFLCIVTVGGSRGWTRTDGCTMLITLRKEQPGTDLSLCLQGTKTIASSVTPWILKFQIFLHSLFKHKLFAIVNSKLVISPNTGSNYVYKKITTAKKWIHLVWLLCTCRGHIWRHQTVPSTKPALLPCLQVGAQGGPNGQGVLRGPHNTYDNLAAAHTGVRAQLWGMAAPAQPAAGSHAAV